jgi:hypothetical protein
MRRSLKLVAIALAVLLSIIVLSAVSGPKTDLNLSITAHVLSRNSPQGESYEFNVNCQDCQRDHSTPEDCSLYDLDSVKVVCPDGTTYELEKNFSIASYTDEVTRTWALVGEPGDGLPESGEHKFELVKNGEVILTETVDYVQSKISYPTDISWERKDEDLYVEWISPDEVSDDIRFEVTLRNKEGTPSLMISKAAEGDAKSAILEDADLVDAGAYSLNVAVYYEDGYACSDSVLFTWALAREDVIPADAVKVTPETDAYPPILHSDEWEEPVPLPRSINTAGAEDSAFVMPDGDILYVWSTPDVEVPPEKQLLDGVTGIYVSHRVGEGWGKAERIFLQDPGKLALDGAAFVQGNTIWFCSAREGFMGVNMFTAEFQDERWQNWRYTGDKLNKEYQIGELHITADGNELWFHSSRTGGKGQYDIWVSRKANGEWQEPENIDAVNTAENEGWPFVTQDGNELWFTRRYLGAPAIFRSRKVDGEWEEPELILSQFAAEPSLDNEGNIYFAHHFFKDDKMIEADIYVAYRKSVELMEPADSPPIPQRGFFMGLLPIPADGQSFEAAYQQASQVVEFVPVWGKPTPFYNLAEELSGSWGETFVAELTRGNGMFPLIHLSFIGPGLTLASPPELEEATLVDPDWRKAYKDAVLDVVRASKPFYLSVGNEVNRWYEKYGAEPGSPNGFQHFVTLYEEIYDAVKRLSPETEVFCTFAREIVAENREADLGVLSMFNPEKIDLFVFTSYPHAVQGINSPQDIPDDYYMKALDSVPNKPLGFSELGWPSLEAFGGEQGQADFILHASGRLTTEQGVDLRLFGWAWLHDVDANDHVGLIKRDGAEKAAYEVWEDLSSSGS